MGGCSDDETNEKGLMGKMKDLYEDEKQRISEKGIGGALSESLFLEICVHMKET